MSTPDTGPSTVKAAHRAEARARRRSSPPADANALASRALSLVESLPGPRRVTCYASYGTEPPTAALCRALADAGFEVLLPRVRDDRLEWVVSGGATSTSAMGIEEPTGPAVPLSPVRAMLIPALAVSIRGDRLGKGGGFYDRALSGLGEEGPVIAAIVDDGDVVDEVPTEEHDCRVDVIVTPTRIIDCAGNSR